MLLRLTAIGFALAFAAVAGTANAHHSDRHKQKTQARSSLSEARAWVADERAATWKCQRALGARLYPTAYRERTARSGRYLNWQQDLWAKRGQACARKLQALKRRERQHPKWIALRLLNYDREQWGCLMYIVRHENARMIPTLDFGGGHGNVYEAYGIPQANPGHKMASHGPDWRTNPETQLRWMIDYCRGRYGSVCGAAYARRTQGYY